MFFKSAVPLAWFLAPITSGALIIALAADRVQASSNYQERDGIYGEIKFAEFCNAPLGLRARVVAEAGSRDSRVKNVEFKMFSRVGVGVNILGQLVVIPASEAWRPMPFTERRYNINPKRGDRRFYDTGVQIYPLIAIFDSPVRFAIHVNHSRGKTIDLGGIVDLGRISPGTCRVYDDGNFR